MSRCPAHPQIMLDPFCWRCEREATGFRDPVISQWLGPGRRGSTPSMSELTLALEPGERITIDVGAELDAVRVRVEDDRAYNAGETAALRWEAGGSGFGLHARGLLDDDGHITDLGRRVYERMQERTP